MKKSCQRELFNHDPTRTTVFIDLYRVSTGLPFSKQFKLENMGEPLRFPDAECTGILLGVMQTKKAPEWRSIS